MPITGSPEWKVRPYVIEDDRGWLYIGTRFVSPEGCDAGRVMTFPPDGVAHSLAEALSARGIASGIKAKRCGNWRVIKGALFPMIAGQGAPSKYQRGHATRVKLKAEQISARAE